MTDLRREALTEGFTPFSLDLSRAQQHVLAASNLVAVTSVDDSTAVIAPTRNVGAVRVGDVQVEVWPKEKVRLAHLLFMLGYTVDPGYRPDSVSGEAYDELWPELAETLVRLAERALAGGVLHGYKHVDETSYVVRGRIRVADQLRRHLNRAHPVEVSYDDYLTDVPENQILRTALRRMRIVPRLREDVARKLSRFDNKLDGVSVLRPRAGLPSWRPSRLNDRYVPALRLAELILGNTAAQAGQGELETASFVVTMWKVFEDFVTTALIEAVAQEGNVARPQEPRTFDQPHDDGAKQVAMFVDLVEYSGKSPVAVYDAKYKAADPRGRYPNADFYQMLAYCTTIGIDRAVLIYAQGGKPRERRVVGSSVTICEWPLDLSLSPEEMLASIREAVAFAKR